MKKRNKILINIVIIVVIILAVIGMCGIFVHHSKTVNKGYIKHLRTHLAVISDNKPLPKNGTYKMIFYRDDCPHCQQVVPKAYAKNTNAGRNFQYRDVVPAHKTNLNIAQKLNVDMVPTQVKVHLKNGHVVSEHKSQSLE